MQFLSKTKVDVQYVLYGNIRMILFYSLTFKISGAMICLLSFGPLIGVRLDRVPIVNAIALFLILIFIGGLFIWIGKEIQQRRRRVLVAFYPLTIAVVCQSIYSTWYVVDQGNLNLIPIITAIAIFFVSAALFIGRTIRKSSPGFAKNR